MSDMWIKETTELIDELQKRLNHLEGEIEELLSERDEVQGQIIAADNLIRLYREKHNVLPSSLQDISPGYFGNKSYPEILVDIAKKSNNYLKVLDATDIMLKAGVGKDKRQVQASTYAALSRMVQAGRFVRITKGEYRYTNGLQKPTQKLPAKLGQKNKRSKSGVQQAVKELKDQNPQWTKKEVLNYLIQAGFDFKGKKPVNAVNIVWAKLGYSKEGKQQVLTDLILEAKKHGADF